MSGIFFVLFVVFAASPAYGQDDDDFVEVPWLSEVIKVKEKGLKSSGVLFRYQPQYRLEEEGIRYGTWVQLLFNDLEGMESMDDTYFYTYKVVITNKKTKEEILNSDWEVVNQGLGLAIEDDNEPHNFQIPIFVGFPMYSGTYEWKVIIKNVGDKKSIEATVDFDVIPNPHITVNKENCSYSEVYLEAVEEQRVVNDQTVYTKDVILWFDNLEGFQKIESSYYVGMEMKILDAENVPLITLDDYFNENGGKINPEDALKISAQYSLSPEVRGQEIILYAKIWDKKGDAWIEAYTSVTLN